MTVAIGCTGGKHRSVAMAEEIAARLRALGRRRPASSTATWAASERWPTPPAAVVALGGGHGLPPSLSALRRVVDDLTAVVTVADNGGSSGRLRDESACCRPATCGWRWPRSAATTTGAGPGPGAPAPVRTARASCTATPSATC